MSAPAESTEPTPDPPPEAPPASASDRRSDVDGKQAQVAELLREAGNEALLILDPANFSWLTSGANAAALDPEEAPALYCTAEARWLVAPNTDAQRLFDEELDSLGFQLKEWPWTGGRAALLDHLSRLRSFACDRPMGGAPLVADQLRQRRLALTAYEAEKFHELGRIVSHSLEATCRSLAVGQTEQEVAGQIAHRLIHRGVEAVAVEVAADGRSRRYRSFRHTDAKVEHYAVLRATGRRFGLHATASRIVSFGPPDETLTKELDAACKITASYVAGSAPEGNVKELLTAGRRICKITGYEHEWRFRAPGHVTGRTAIERAWPPDTTDVLRPGWAVTWQASIGAASSCDTYLVTPEGAKWITLAHGQWPQKRIRIQGNNIARPDVLQR